MTQKLISKKELKSVYGVPYNFAHIARLEAASQFPNRVRLGACKWEAKLASILASQDIKPVCDDVNLLMTA